MPVNNTRSKWMRIGAHGQNTTINGMEIKPRAVSVVVLATNQLKGNTMIRFAKGMYVKGKVLISPKAAEALEADGVEINSERGFYIPHGSPCLAVLRHRPGSPASEGLLKVAGEQFHSKWCEDWGME